MSENKVEYIKADGTSIVLTNGTELSLRYGMAALAEIEKKHGSINALVKVLQEAENGPIITTLGHALWAGTSRKTPLDAFLDLLDPSQIATYVKAFEKAFSEAMGSSSDPKAETV